MNNLKEEEIQKAFRYWHHGYQFRNFENELNPFLQLNLTSAYGKPEGWLKKARVSLFLSMGEMADRLEVSRSVYAKYEEAEVKGTISLATLAKAAAAMDCEIVYAIRPKARMPFSFLVWEKLLAASIVHPWLKRCDQRKRAEALVGIVKRKLAEPQFRRAQGWSQRANEPTDF